MLGKAATWEAASDGGTGAWPGGGVGRVAVGAGSAAAGRSTGAGVAREAGGTAEDGAVGA